VLSVHVTRWMQQRIFGDLALAAGDGATASVRIRPLDAVGSTVVDATTCNLRTIALPHEPAAVH